MDFTKLGNVIPRLLRPARIFISKESSLTSAKIFDKKPVIVALEKDKDYRWCACGYSSKQPFCDGSHKKVNEEITDSGQKLKPHKFNVDESKEYAMCNCKHTKNVPFCDGTHKDL